MTDIRDQARTQMQEWIRSNARRVGKTPTAVAREIQVSTTTLTKFLNDPKHKFLPAADTIAKLEAYFGERAPSAAARTVRPTGFYEAEAVPYAASDNPQLAAAVAALVGNSNARAAFTMRGRALENLGIQPGAVLIVDLNATPRDGDIVCAQVYDNTGGATTVFRRYWKLVVGVLTPATHEEAAQRPLVVDDEKVVVRGVVTQTVGNSRIAA